jgi:hypothetical protein
MLNTIDIVARGIAVPSYSNDCIGIISMPIYSPLAITEEQKKNYKPTRLYIKECNGLKYFGKSIRHDILKYTGSGIRWLNHIEKHGTTNIQTLWISDWFKCPEELHNFATKFSIDNDIVNSPDWANLAIEDGFSGGHYNLAAKTELERHRIYKKVSNTLNNKTEEEKALISKKHSLSLKKIWAHKTTDQRDMHAANTSIGVKAMWANLSDDLKSARKAKEMHTKNAKSAEEKAAISQKQREAKINRSQESRDAAIEKMLEKRRARQARDIVEKLNQLAVMTDTKLGKNWRARSDEWILAQINDLENK